VAAGVPRCELAVSYLPKVLACSGVESAHPGCGVGTSVVFGGQGSSPSYSGIRVQEADQAAG
jgi:hypothetical protein